LKVLAVAGLAAAGWLAAGAAQAIVGGAEHAGPLARASVMVLSSKGGVCTAVLVAREAVLTAAHCVPGGLEHRIHFRQASGEAALIAPAARAVHPGYDAKAIAGRRRSIDLALLRLPAGLPARFETAVLSALPAPGGARVTVGGYGLASEGGDARPTGVFRAADLAVVEPYGPSRILVWLQGEPGVGACTGDSGGPIALGSAVFALTSWSAGSGRRRCGRVSQGVLLGPQRDWIDRTLAGWGLSARWQAPLSSRESAGAALVPARFKGTFR